MGIGTPGKLPLRRDTVRSIRGKILVRWIAIISLLSGCAGNTAQQDMVYRAWETCRAEGRIPGQIQLARVEPDGRYWIQSLQDSRSSYGVSPAQTCMDEELAKTKQAR